jgi:hypothetical protein
MLKLDGTPPSGVGLGGHVGHIEAVAAEEEQGAAAIRCGRRPGRLQKAGASAVYHLPVGEGMT